ncbi:murein DD-endopeptidase MepM/ murein hydrolase activator NlpD [Georgenia soli]|uniref:Murein DD-endopeptidase MepM/ murein hydrolase activator NlpD n=1 Tax=Georgenia soli TaxID=638953 RepID=A0A2A9ENT6_9MICO|nr:M23 family metallopeptidase [Georgenia soli]PFG39879.1 murein DD-endopeptidase MepM/ murein hydrolase activator NlpD [Georgenia soli]
MTERYTPSTADCTDTQVITVSAPGTERTRGAHRAETKPLSRRGRILRASALGVLGVLTLATPVVAVSTDDADAVAAKATPVSSDALQALDAGFAAAAKEGTSSDALVADRAADDRRTELERASRVKVREALPEDKPAGPAAEAKPAPAPAPAPEPAPEPVAVAEPPRPEVVMPVAAGDFRLTSQYGARWGSMHAGVDFAAPLDTPIHAVADGEVTYVGVGKDGRSSMLISIRHNVGGKVFESWYVHMYPDDLKVTAGQKVKAGDVIAGVGNNGNSTGPHLHFEIHTAPGSTTEPLGWMESLGAVDVGQM